MNLSELTAAINAFTKARDWEQFHNAKNLAAALSVEVAELQETLLWTPTDESSIRVDEKRESIEAEIGDILIYLLRFCDVTGIDPIEAAQNKMLLNEKKYPIQKSKGNSKKYTEF